MRVAIRAGIVWGKICTALLLGMVPVALVIPGSDVAFGQAGTAAEAQAPLFTAIDLTPSGFTDSHALGISGGQQAGDAWVTPATATHALLWRGSAASVVDLNPSGFVESKAYGICGRQQVGDGSGPATGGHSHALLWRGSVGSVVDLNPSGFESEAHGTSGGQQVGFGSGPATGRIHALLWRGSAASVVDLNPSGFAYSVASGISGGEQVGVGSGPATGGWDHALLWRGSAASIVDLNPRGFDSSSAVGTNGEEEVGFGNGHALLWRGSAASVVDLHAFLPPGFVSSAATGIDSNGDIVGYADQGEPTRSHAFLWRRNVRKPGTSRGQNPTRC